MNHTPNDAQLLVLRWVAAGADLKHPPNDTFKTSAVALHTRGLVNLDKRRGRWSIEITDAGRFYLEHGYHPTAGPPKPQQKARPAATIPVTTRTEKAVVAGTVLVEPARVPELQAEPERPPEREAVPMPVVLRHPHKAVKEIVDHKARLDVPAEQRSRALLILHALAQEAIRRGWEVIPNPSKFEVDRWNGRRKRVSPALTCFRSTQVLHPRLFASEFSTRGSITCQLKRNWLNRRSTAGLDPRNMITSLPTGSVSTCGLVHLTP